MAVGQFMIDITLRDIIFEALNNAVASGFDEFVYTKPATEVANDLLEYDVDLEHENVIEVAAFVEAWRSANNG